MSTIVDHQIRDLARTQGLVEPFDPEFINPASIDVRLGPTLILEDDTEVDIENGVYVMEPGEFILAHTIEYVRVPPSLECVFNLKSSRGREGYQHLLAAYIDPGFHGQVTLELVNVNRKKRLPLEHGMRIGQLRFSRLDAVPMRTYAQTGRYHKDLGVQRSKG